MFDKDHLGPKLLAEIPETHVQEDLYLLGS